MDKARVGLVGGWIADCYLSNRAFLANYGSHRSPTWGTIERIERAAIFRLKDEHKLRRLLTRGPLAEQHLGHGYSPCIYHWTYVPTSRSGPKTVKLTRLWPLSPLEQLAKCAQETTP